MRPTVAAALVASVLLAGCQDDLPKATEITHMRVLGTKLEVLGDETRTTPKPGESVKATFSTVFPSQSQTNQGVQAMMIACTAPDRYTGGLPVCQEFLDAATGKVSDDITKAIDITDDVKGTDDEPEMDVGAAMEIDAKLTCEDLPMPKIRIGRLSIQCLRGDPIAQFDVDPRFKAKRMLFVGVVCEHGTAFIDPNDPLLFGCDDNKGETTRVNGLIPVQYEDADENRNPRIEDDLKLVLSTYTAPWLAPEGELPPAENCNGAEQDDQKDSLRLPYADPGMHEIRLEYDASARETSDGAPEDLEFTVFTTGGEMERRFTLFSGGDEGQAGKLRGEVEWKPPPFKELSSHGRLVRFFVTVRDRRGGFDIATRVACVH